MKLPVTFESNVSSSNRVTVPTWLSYIEPGDLLEGYVQLLDRDDQYPFSKTLSMSRHITVGHIKQFLPSRELPSRLRITIESVKKLESEGEEFNMFGYKEVNGKYRMIFNTMKLDPSIQLHLDNFTANFVEKYFENENSTIKQCLELKYLDKVKKWIKPISLVLEDEMGAKIPVIIFLKLSQEYSERLSKYSTKIDTLLQRFSKWIFDINDFNIEILSKLSSQLKLILEKQQEPEYLDMKDIFPLPDLQREIILIAIKEHPNRGITFDKLVLATRESKQNVDKAIEKQVNKGYLRRFEENETDIFDTLWIV